MAILNAGIIDLLRLYDRRDCRSVRSIPVCCSYLGRGRFDLIFVYYYVLYCSVLSRERRSNPVLKVEAQKYYHR